MGDRMSSDLFDVLFTTGWSVIAGKVASFGSASSAQAAMSREDFLRGLPRLLLRPAKPSDLLADRVALGDDGLGLLRVDRSAADVADDVWGAALDDPPSPLGKVGGDDTDRTQVVL